MDDVIHDFAYVGMNNLGMDETVAYKWAVEMQALIRKQVFRYATEMDLWKTQERHQG